MRTTVGIPGTGLSYSTSSGSRRRRRSYASRGRSRRQLEAAEREARYEAPLAEIQAEQADLEDRVEQWRDVPALPSPAEYQAEAFPQPFEHDAAPPASPDQVEERARFGGEVGRQLREEQGSGLGGAIGVVVVGGLGTALLTLVAWLGRLGG